MSDAYREQIEEMATRVREWDEENNPAIPPRIMSLTPSTVLVATVSDALEFGLLRVNGSGRALVEYVCEPYSIENEPTVQMLMQALDYAESVSR